MLPSIASVPFELLSPKFKTFNERKVLKDGGIVIVISFMLRSRTSNLSSPDMSVNKNDELRHFIEKKKRSNIAVRNY